MLSLGDGVALAGLFGVMVTVLVIWNRNSPEINLEPYESVNRYVSNATCVAVQKGINKQLSVLEKQNSQLIEKMNGLDKYIREYDLFKRTKI